MAPLRVLHIISSTMRAGVAAMLMNVYREIGRDRFQFDFVAHDLGSDDFGAEIESLGGRVFRIPFLSEAGMHGFTALIYDIIRQNGPYAAVHAHTDYQAGFSAKAAAKAGVPVRICHAHSDTRGIHDPVFLLKKQLGRMLINRYATKRCACSREAGISTFGRRAAARGLVTVVRNGIDLSGFEPCPPGSREALRKQCLADAHSRLIGCVGRLSPEKNPSFVLDIAAAARNAHPEYRFVFAGDGVMREELIRRRQQLGLENTVRLLGTRDDVPSLMQCFDLVVIPSFSEGFSMAALEAQAAGTPVLSACRLPEEADMGLGLLHSEERGADAPVWLDRMEALMNAKRPDSDACIAAVRAKGFDARQNAHSILRLYEPVSLQNKGTP